MAAQTVTEYYTHSTSNFGKYKGKTVEEVLTLDPSYLLWAHKNVEWFALEKEVWIDAWTLDGGEGLVPQYKEKGAASKQDATPSTRTVNSMDDLFDNPEDDVPF